MSVTHHPSFNFRRHVPAPGGVRPAGDFQDLELDVASDSVTFKRVEENGSAQLIVLWCTAILFMLFVVSVLPAMKLTGIGNGLAVIVGVAVLATVALIVQSRVKTTLVRLDKQGVHIEQGTPLDQELIEIDWEDLQSVELEPVNAEKEALGMQLEFLATKGKPVKALAGVGVGDLNAVRQAVLKARRGPSDATPQP